MNENYKQDYRYKFLLEKVETKVCLDCGEKRFLRHFSKRKKYGYQSYCHRCMNKRKKDYTLRKQTNDQ